MTPAVCLALALYFEARTENIEGQIATAWSIHNSAYTLYHKPVTICHEVIKSGRYIGVNNGFTGRVPSSHDFRNLVFISQAVIEGRLADPTKGAIAFECTKWASCKRNPWWAKNLVYAGTFGTQRFWRKK